MFSKLTSGKDHDGKEIYRSYTPVSKVSKRGEMQLLIKVYFPIERFPKGGALTQYLHSREIGDMMKIAGPQGGIEYKKQGKFYFSYEKTNKKFKKFSMVGGGSGITPLYQVINHLLEEPEQNFDINLLYANKTEDDILLKGELEQLNEAKSIKLALTLDRPPTVWKGYKGFVSDEMLKEVFPPYSSDHLFLLCGPPIMVNDVFEKLIARGFKEENIYKF